MTRKHGGSSAFKRLAVLFFLIELIVLVGVSLLLFRYAGIQEQADMEALDKVVVQSIQQIDEQIQSIYRLAENLSTDTRLSQIAYHMYPDEYERSRLVLGIIGNIRNISTLNTFIEDITVTFPAENLELGNIDGYNKWASYSFPDDAEFALSEYLFFSDGRLKIRIAHPLISRALGNEPDYECEVLFSQEFLYSHLTLFGENEQSGAMLILSDQKGNTLPVTEHETDPVTVHARERLKVAGALSLREDVQIGQNRFSVSYEPAGKYPITLVTWRNINSLSANMTTTLISVFAVIFMTGAFFLLIILQANRSVARPIYQLRDAFKEVKNGDLSTRIRHNKNDEFHFIYDSFNEMTGRIEQLIRDIREQYNLLQNAELMQLQAQIDPHFLYNSFLVIKYMAGGEEYEQITEFVSALAEYYRFVNREIRQAIPLSAEVKHMETYVYIQQMRFESRIQVEEGSLPDKAGGFLVPKLILQPLVENCYTHGLQNKLNSGVIFISFGLEGKRLTIEISDNGGEMTEEKLEELRQRITETDDGSICHALANTRRRLELAYGAPDMLSLSIGPEGGLKVTMIFDITRDPSDLL